MTKRFADKAVLITGGAKGIGRAAVLRLMDEGARVAVIEAEPDTSTWATSLKDEAAQRGATLFYTSADVTDEPGLKAALALCVDAVGLPDVLINNVGFSQSAARLDDMTTAQWNHAQAVNVTSAFLTIRELLPAMRTRGHGSIVNMSSVAGLFVSENAHINYHAAKAAIIGLTHKVAFEEGPNGIRVNCVSPGSVMTERVKPRYDVLSEEEYAKRMSGIPLRRGSRPEEIAAAVLFLASDDASYITGTNLHVNGGRFMS